MSRDRWLEQAPGLLFVVAAVICGGCSFVFVRGPPSNTAPRPESETASKVEVDCTSSRLAPVLDVLGSVVTGAATVLFSICPGDPDYEGGGSAPSCTGQISAAAIGTLAYVASAVYGFGTAASCDEARLPRK